MGVQDHAKLFPVRQLDARFVGFFLLFGFSSALGSEAATAWPASGSLFALTTNVARFVVFVAAVLLARRVPTLLGRPRVIKGAALAMALFSTVFFALTALPVVPFAVVVALGAVVIVNAAFSVLYLAWMEAYARMNVYYALVYFVSAHVLSSLFSLFVLSLGALFPIAVIMALAPLLSAALLLGALRDYAAANEFHGEEQSADWSISVRPLVLLAVFSFAGTFTRSPISAGESLAVRLGVCAFCLVILGWVILRFERVELRWFYQLAVPLMVVGVLGAFISPQWGQMMGAAASSAGLALFMTFVTGIFCNISYRFGVSALWLFGFAQASMTVGTLVAQVVDLFAADGLHEAAASSMAVLAVVLVAVSMLLVSDSDFKSTWGIEPDEKKVGVKRELTLEERCDLIARRFGLTRREEEICLYLASGDTLSSIGQKLFIADSTMKTHSRHIYRKIGVENKQDLQAFVASYRR